MTHIRVVTKSLLINMNHFWLVDSDLKIRWIYWLVLFEVGNRLFSFKKKKQKFWLLKAHLGTDIEAISDTVFSTCLSSFK